MRDKSGKFLPGHDGLKKPGHVNKVTAEIKAALTEFLKGKVDSLESTYKLVSDKEKLRFIADLLPYCLPKQKEITIEDVTPRAAIDYTKLSPGALKEVLNAVNINQGYSDEETDGAN